MNSATVRTIDADEPNEIPLAQSTTDAEKAAGIDRDYGQPITSSQVRPTGGTPRSARADVNVPSPEARAASSKGNNPEETNAAPYSSEEELREQDAV